MRKKLLFILLFLASVSINAQTKYIQTVKGRVIDAENHYGLSGASVCIYQNEKKIKCATTDAKGNYKINKVPIGRYMLIYNYVGYLTGVKTGVVVQSGKQNVINVQLVQSVKKLSAVKISSHKGIGASNDMALISARSFDISETEKYAGSRGDPARMVSNYAGVQGADDSRNDIVVRGNSPLGVLWRLNGISIPNPNHFAVSGTTGGPVSILNNQTLASSDFYTGAFPAQFGNCLAAVFDLKLRNGNDEKDEFQGRIGFLGLKGLAEGPISKKSGSSFLFAYRYSSLTLFDKLGIDIGTDAIPHYQDLTFKLNFPLKKNGNIAVFGIGGLSHIDIMISDEKDTSTVDLYGQNDRNQHFGTRMGVLGVSFLQPINKKLLFKTVFAYSYQNQHAYHQYVVRHVNSAGDFVVDSLYDLLRFNFNQGKISNHTHFNYIINSKNTMRIGFLADEYQFDFIDSLYFININFWKKRWDYTGNALLFQPYVMYKHKFSDQLIATLGWHGQYFSLNGSASWLEPRAALKWKMSNIQSLSAGFGIFSQMQPTYTYFYRVLQPDGQYEMINQDMGFTRSNQYVISYNRTLSEHLYLRLSTYYQQLYDVPIEIQPSAFSLLNQGSSFSRFYPSKLTNKGTGENYGVELTLSKTFSHKYYYMLTASLYKSDYKGSDGVQRNTDFNGNFSANFLFGKTLKINEKSEINFGIKATIAGGKRYGLVDTAASKANDEVTYQDSLYNHFQFQNYFRLDLKIDYTFNTKKLTHEIGLDLVNITGQKNILNLTYDPIPGTNEPPIRKNYQLGFLPLFYYRLSF